MFTVHSDPQQSAFDNPQNVGHRSIYLPRVGNKFKENTRIEFPILTI